MLTVHSLICELKLILLYILLVAWLSTYKQVQKKIRQLSGGEKARVALCMFMLRPANLLVLDEPTNHLDIPAKEMVCAIIHKLSHTLCKHCQTLQSLKALAIAL
jgi:ATP-binding cassette, subfamily F, member 3